MKFKTPATSFTLAALLAAGLSVNAAANIDEEGRWRPTPPETKMPLPKKPPREPRTPARLTSMTLDGTFESYRGLAAVTQSRDRQGHGLFFGLGGYQMGGVDGGNHILVPGGAGPTIGFEEKKAPLKPNTWYRIEYMFKGIAYKKVFSYPYRAPNRDVQNDGHLNEVIIDNNHGGGYNFYYVCSECKFVKQGAAEDGAWITFGFNELPDTCPECGADGDKLYRDGDRRPYKDWTLVYEDFRTNDYVGHFQNVGYYWMLVIIGSASAVAIDNVMVYEITGEGGEAVGGDLVTEMPVDKPCPPPRPVAVEVAFGSQAAGMMRDASDGFMQARKEIAATLGIAVPRVQLDRRDSLDADAAAISICGKTVWTGKPANAQALAAQLAELLRANAHRLLTLDDVRVLIDREPAKISDAAKALPLPKIHAELRKALAAGQSISDLPTVLETIVQ